VIAACCFGYPQIDAGYFEKLVFYLAKTCGMVSAETKKKKNSWGFNVGVCG